MIPSFKCQDDNRTERRKYLTDTTSPSIAYLQEQSPSVAYLRGTGTVGWVVDNNLGTDIQS